MIRYETDGFRPGCLISIAFISIAATLLVCRKCDSEMETSHKCVKTETTSYLTIDSLLSKYHIKNPKVVRAQIAIETGHMTNGLYKDANNLFSMKVALTRPTTAVGEKNGYAVYRSIEESVIDYGFYQSRIRKKNMSDLEYVQLLQDSGYAQDKDYVSKLKRMLK